MKYEELLTEALKKLPENTGVKTARFEIPKVRGHIQGNRTVITNFNQIVSSFSCDPQHFLKYLLRELATPGKFDGKLLELGRKLNSVFINGKIKQYAEAFVLCRTCGKPDTKVIKKEGVDYLKCTACGAQHPVKL